MTALESPWRNQIIIITTARKGSPLMGAYMEGGTLNTFKNNYTHLEMKEGDFHELYG